MLFDVFFSFWSTRGSLVSDHSCQAFSDSIRALCAGAGLLACLRAATCRPCEKRKKKQDGNLKYLGASL